MGSSTYAIISAAAQLFERLRATVLISQISAKLEMWLQRRFKVHLFLFATPQSSSFNLKMLINIGLGKPNSFLEELEFLPPDPQENPYLDHPQFLRLKKKKRKVVVVWLAEETIIFLLQNNTNCSTASKRLLTKDQYESEVSSP